MQAHFENIRNYQHAIFTYEKEIENLELKIKESLKSGNKRHIRFEAQVMRLKKYQENYILEIKNLKEKYAMPYLEQLMKQEIIIADERNVIENYYYSKDLDWINACKEAKIRNPEFVYGNYRRKIERVLKEAWKYSPIPVQDSNKF